MPAPRMSIYAYGEERLAGLLAAVGHQLVGDPAAAELIILGEVDLNEVSIVPGQIVIETTDRFFGELAPLAQSGAMVARMREVGGGFWHAEVTDNVLGMVVELLLEEIGGTVLSPWVVYYQLIVTIAEMELGREGYPGADAIEFSPALLQLTTWQLSDADQRRFYVEALRRYAQLTGALDLEFWAHEQLDKLT